MWNHTRVTIFPAGHKADIAQAIIDRGFHPKGSIADFYGAFLWTEPDAREAYPDKLIVNTMLERRTYFVPRLLEIVGGALVLSVLDDVSGSGAGRAPNVLHIVLREYHPT